MRLLRFVLRQVLDTIVDGAVIVVVSFLALVAMENFHNGYVKRKPDVPTIPPPLKVN